MHTQYFIKTPGEAFNPHDPDTHYTEVESLSVGLSHGPTAILCCHDPISDAVASRWFYADINEKRNREDLKVVQAYGWIHPWRE
jgi:hypothetical protein